jgi:hypothetical protein
MRILRNESSSTRLAEKGETDAKENNVARVALSDHQHQPEGSMGRFHGDPSNKYVKLWMG